MSHFTKVPVDLFEKSLNEEELFLELHQYHAHAMGWEGWEGENLDEVFLPAKSAGLEEETMLVSSFSFVMERKELIKALDLIIYVYLTYLAHQSKSSVIKIDVKEISRKISVKKTRVGISLNSLLRENLLYPQEKSGFYSLAELKYPKESSDSWDVIYKDLRWPVNHRRSNRL